MSEPKAERGAGVVRTTPAMDVGEQVEAARTSVLVHRDASLGSFVVQGPDRVSWLNGLVTCNLATLTEERAVYGLAVTQKGRILADVVVLADGERLVVVAPATAIESLRAALDHYLVMEDVEVTPGDHAVFFAHGPRAGDAVAACRGTTAWAPGVLGAAFDRAGLGGAIVLAPASDENAVGDALGAAATARAGAVADEAGWEALRIERAVPKYGADFDATTYPQEATLEKRAVSFDKGCYLGQEVVCMLEMRGHVKRKLVPLVLEGAEAPARGAEVHDAAGAKVGEVTSASPSPTLGHAVALAMIKAAQTEPGTALRVAGIGATVREIPAP